jgi:hypothetical protein
VADKPVDEVVNVDAVLDALPGSPTSSDVYEATLPFSSDAVAAAAARRALSGGGGGGSPAGITAVRFPITFATSGLVPESFPITAVDLGVYPITSLVLGDGGEGSFTVAGDHTAAFPVASAFTVSGSTGNDNPYTVASSSFAAGHTTVAVPEFFYDPTVDGSLVVGQSITVAGDRTAAFAPGVAFFAILEGGASSGSTVLTSTFTGGNTIIAGAGTFLGDDITYVSAVVAVGATVYTPAVGDILLGTDSAPLTLASVSQAWNGTTPTLKVLTESVRRAQGVPFVSLDATVADETAVGSLDISPLPGFSVGSDWRLWRFTTADPILVQADDNNNADPGATQGAAEIVLLVIPA